MLSIYEGLLLINYQCFEMKSISNILDDELYINFPTKMMDIIIDNNTPFFLSKQNNHRTETNL